MLVDTVAIIILETILLNAGALLLLNQTCSVILNHVMHDVMAIERCDDILIHCSASLYQCMNTKSM